MLQRLPSWSLTIVVTLVILYLTLWPDPLPDDTPQFFPGADKVVHGLMFGGLTLVILIDRQRYLARQTGSSHANGTELHGQHIKSDRIAWLPLNIRFVLSVALASSLFGAVIECLQWGMGLGRGFEVWDIVADTLGSFIFAMLWLRLQHYWSK